MEATEHAQNHVTVNLILKSFILFISLGRNDDDKCWKKLQTLFFDFSHSFM